MTAIGFVGLGAMGGRMAGRLVAAGHEVYGNNRTASKAAGLVERGLQWRDTPRDVAEAASVIFSMVADDAALDAITMGPDGILAGLGPSKIYVDMSTVSPQTSRELAERVRALDAQMLDAPVSGSVPAAEEGSLAIMVGGPQDAFHTIEPLLRQLGRTITHVGGNGQGLVLKLAINISVGAQTLAFSEGLLLAERGGIDPQVAAGVMAASAIGSPAVKARAPLMLDLPEAAWFDVDLMQKDTRLALQAGDALGGAAARGGHHGQNPYQGTRARLRRARHRRPVPGARADERCAWQRGRLRRQRVGVIDRTRRLTVSSGFADRGANSRVCHAGKKVAGRKRWRPSPVLMICRQC